MPNNNTTVGTTATPITRGLGKSKRCNLLILSLPTSAGAPVYTGDSKSITTATGLPLYPGEERTYTGAAAQKDYWAIVAAATETLRVEESN